MTTVQEIHNDFYGAEERLFMEAVMLTQAPPKKTSSIPRRMKELGFGQAKPVREDTIARVKAAAADELVRTIEHYRHYYPMHKFITEEEVAVLCAKYGLILGGCENYIGDIPEKNLVDIEQFKLRKEDYSPVLSPWLDSMIGMYREKRWRSLADDREIDKAPFKICAPRADFNTFGSTVVNGYKLVNDPIVLQPVKKDGYLIVTAWGEEASDEAVVNGQMN